MNPKQLNAFRMVMQHGSITDAARALNVSQPAVSRLLADLEADLGFDLLIRRRGGSQPTNEAKVFLAEVEKMFYSLDQLKKIAYEIKTLKRAAVRLATMPMVSLSILPQTVLSLASGGAMLDITHDVHLSPLILDRVVSRQIDLGIGQFSAARRDVEVMAAYTSDCVCVMQPDHPLASRSVIRPEDLHGVEMVMLDTGTAPMNRLMNLLAARDCIPRIVVETQPGFSCCCIVAKGIGVTVVDSVTAEFFSDRLVCLPFDPSIPFDFQIIKSPEVPLSLGAARLFDELVSVIERNGSCKKANITKSHSKHS